MTAGIIQKKYNFKRIVTQCRGCGTILTIETDINDNKKKKETDMTIYEKEIGNVCWNCCNQVGGEYA
jgi:adenosylmethionine-8-amino-7-oxononanoate aminotransferase